MSNRPNGSSNDRAAVIVGAGMAGLLASTLLARSGWKVAVHDKRNDLNAPNYRGRSVNFTLSDRGRTFLRRAGILDSVLPHAVELRGRSIHLANGRVRFVPYGNQPHEVLHAVRRQDLHRALLKAARAETNVTTFFSSSIQAIDVSTNTAVFETEGSGVESRNFDLLIGADGASSKTFELLAAAAPATRTAERSDWRYTEFLIPASAGGNYVLDPRSLHLWPRKSAIICAIPNPDGTFIANLLMPAHEFARLRCAENSIALIQEKFSDLLSLCPLEILSRIHEQKVSDIISTSLDRWDFSGKAILIGDACHAISPFLGQGMNAALEDASALAQSLDAESSHGRIGIANAISRFAHQRRPDTDALMSLSRAHLKELNTNLGSAWHLAGNRAELILDRKFGQSFRPRYSRIAHSTEPYRAALARPTAGRRFISSVLRRGLQSCLYLSKG